MPYLTVVRRTETLDVGSVGQIAVTLEERDQAQTFLLLHGGGGPATLRPFADLLANRKHTHVLLPTHPGFDGTTRPDTLDSVRALAQLYSTLLEAHDLHDVTVIGSSLGGWIAAELALLRNPRVSGIVLINAIGIEVEGHPPADVSKLSPTELARLSFHDPSIFAGASSHSSRPTPNLGALAAYGGPSISDPELRSRIGGIEVPVVVIWGESDGIVDSEYGREYANAIPDSCFILLARSGHLPTLESPEQLLDVLWDLGADRPVRRDL